MTGFFLDTSALVKLYHREPGTNFLLKLYRSKASLFISELARVEFRSTVFRKLREKELSEQAADAALLRFAWDGQSRFVVLPTASLVYDNASDLLSLHGRDYGLRALDSIQLATFLTYRETNQDIFICADARLFAIAKRMKLQSIMPSDGSPV